MDGMALLGNGVGVVGALIWLIYMIGTGRLVTRREVTDRLKDKDQQIADKNEQISNLTTTVQVRDAQVDKLTDETGATMIRLLNSVEAMARQKRPR